MSVEIPKPQYPDLGAQRAVALALVAEEQNARGLLVGHRFVSHDGAVKELVGVKIDLEEGWTLGDFTGDQGF